MCKLASRSRRVLIALALATAVVAPRAGTAQSVEQLKRRLVASARRGLLLKDSLAELHEMKSRDLPADSLVVGDLTFRFVRANLGKDLEADLQAAAATALGVADSVLGSQLHRIASEAPILATRSRVRFGEFTRVGLVTLEIANGGGRSTTLRAPVTVRKLAEGILDLLGTMATSHVPASVIGWGGQWVPSRPLTPDLWEDAAIDMASSNAAVARTCYAGSQPACESALALTILRDSLTDWYTPEGWRVIVASWKPPNDAYAVIADRIECLEKNVHASCERLARSRTVPIPLTFATRSTLIGLAFQRGGRDAYSRMLAAKGTTLQILAATAGVTPDSLMHEWRSRVVAASPKSSRPSPLEATVFVAWIALFGVAAGRRRP
jgi:hypothetical protein